MFFGEALPNRQPSWRPPPGVRGSYTILSSCVITLVLCIWTAVHLNIPEHNIGKKYSKWDPRGWIAKQQWRKVGWLILGLVAPEMLAFTAWTQRRDAYRFTKEINQIWDEHARGSAGPIQHDECISMNNEEPRLYKTASKTSDITPCNADDIELGITPIPKSPPSNPHEQDSSNIPEGSQSNGVPESNELVTSPRQHQWTVTHSFYVLSRGFVFDTSRLAEDQKFLPGSRDRVTLSWGTTLKLAHELPELVPDISEAEINDKSKASALAKGIVCLQASWFIIQCIFRLAQSLPTSLLELNTFAHAMCSLLIYLLWWKKPLDIEEPTSIHDKRMHAFCAVCCYCSWFDDLIDASRIEFDIGDVGFGAAGETEEKLPPGGPPESARLISGQCIPGTAIRGARSLTTPKVKKVDLRSYYYPNDLRRWKLAQSFVAVEKNGSAVLSDDSIRVYDQISNFSEEFNFNQAIQILGGGNYYLPHLPKIRDIMPILFGFTFAGFSYGGLHLLAWHSPFLSRTQTLLWRVSALVIGASGPALMILGLIQWLDNREQRVYSRMKIVTKKLTGVSKSLYSFFYLFARAYLVVECFISLAYLPDGVFEQPRWNYYFPHAGG
jgi:hypothetical protein